MTIFFGINLISSFFKDGETESLLFMEINIWYYRLFWLGATIFVLSNYLYSKKLEKKE